MNYVNVLICMTFTGYGVSLIKRQQNQANNLGAAFLDLYNNKLRSKIKPKQKHL